MPFEPWSARQQDFARYFNPGYIALLTHFVVRGFAGKDTGMPLSLMFPAVPMVLHPSIRAALPKTSLARMSKWLRNNPEVQADLLATTRLLVPQIKEGLLASMRSGWVITEDGMLRPGGKPRTGKNDGFEDDTRKAAWIGSWLAGCGTEREIYLMIGVKP